MNFIVFQPDELRAESVGCYGHPLAPTPNIDALAAQGTRFDQCHVQHTVCSPSRCSMMTGWYPHIRGHRTLWHLLRPDEPNFLRYLKQAGYDVRMYGKNDLLAAETFADSTSLISAAMLPVDCMWNLGSHCGYSAPIEKPSSNGFCGVGLHLTRKDVHAS